MLSHGRKTREVTMDNIIGKQDVILTDEFLGIKVVLTHFGMHLLGKNDTPLASRVGREFSREPMGVLQPYAEQLVEAFVNRQYKMFSHVYHIAIVNKKAV